jgi:hypothetical protein
MTNTKNFLYGAFVAAAFALVPATFAADVVTAEEAPKSKIDAAWKAAFMDFEGVLTPEQHAQLNNIANHSAAARLCDGLELDVGKVANAVNGIVMAAEQGMSDEHKLERISNILVSLGMIKGLLLAEGSLDKDSYCAAAMKLKAEEPNDHFWK